MELVIAIFVITMVADIYLRLDTMFDDLGEWMDDAVIETEDEEQQPEYLDNSEYDWGHNIKNYMEEEL